jgi:hypothetical protein
MTDVNMATVIPESEMTAEMVEDDPEGARLLKAQLVEAKAYLQSHKWCHAIKETYFGDGIGGVVAVFLFLVDAGSRRVDEWFWVVTGDLPSCYMVTDNAPNPALALEGYCELMEDWVDAVRAGDSLDDVYPVDAPATQENADLLDNRIKFLREEMIPLFQAAIDHVSSSTDDKKS